MVVMMISGCSTTKPIIVTKTIDRPVPVFCEVMTPAECKDAYAVDRVSVTDDPITINRAFRQEIEERWTCEIKLRAALQGCNSK
jgi:hypothetical protein